MNYYADSNYIHAKIYALHGQLLARRDYYDIAKNLNFQSILPGLDAGSIRNDCTSVKEKLFENQIRVVLSLADAPVSSRGLLIFFLRYFETLNLKLLCAEASGLHPAPCIWYNIGGFAALGRDMFRGAEGIEAVIEFTRLTWMKDFFTAKSVPAPGEAELLIDRALFRIAAGFIYSMNFTDRTGSLKLVSGLAARMRLSWRWRLQHIYGMNTENISNYIESNIPVPASRAVLGRYVKDRERKLLKELMINNRLDGEGLVMLERLMERIVLRDTGRMFHDNFHSVNTVICYLVLLYRQIRNLFAIADGLRLGLAPDIIMEHIVCEE